MMTFKKVTLLVAAFLSLATLTIGGGIAAVRTCAGNQESAPAAGQKEKPAHPKDVDPPAEARVIDRQLQELLELARLQYDTASRLYQNAQTEYPNVVEAGLQLDDIELRLANGPAVRRAVKERSVKRLQQMESVAESRMQAAREQPLQSPRSNCGDCRRKST